ncbi:hypothetical protein FQN49_007236 [Arthroderma sp. PD_2]|nr:hypothetical protein FQN49_007236 [Arthroderma sp. PD_2]
MGKARGRQSSLSVSKWRRLKEKKAVEKECADCEAHICATKQAPETGPVADCPPKPFVVNGDNTSSRSTSAGRQPSLLFAPSMVNEVESVRAAFERHGIVFGCPGESIPVSPPNSPCQFTTDNVATQQHNKHHPRPPVPNSSPYNGGGYTYLPVGSLPPARVGPPYIPPALPAPSYQSSAHQGPLFNPSSLTTEICSSPNCRGTNDSYTPIPLDNLPPLPHNAPSPSLFQNHQHPPKKHAYLRRQTLRQADLTASHLLATFNSRMHSDFNLTLYSCASVFLSVTHSIHRVIASRSRRLASLFDNIDNGNPPSTIYITAGSSFVYPAAFESALLFLYGQPLVDRFQLDRQIPLPRKAKKNTSDNAATEAARISRMRFALCYAMAGAFLMDSHIMERGVELVSSVLCWETLETALSFGLCPVHFELSVIDESFSPSNNSGDGIPDTSPKIFHKRPLDTDMVIILAGKVLSASLQFVVNNIPTDFKLDKSSLSTIRSSRTGEKTPSISLLFLSLPFKQLRKIFKYMLSAGKLTEKLVKEVIREREAHRMQTLRTLALKGNLRSHPDSENEVLGWEEQALFTAKQPSGAIIGREWKGLEIRPAMLAFSRLRRSNSF